MMLILIVVIFIVCHSIRSVVNTFECIQFSLYGDNTYWPAWINYLVQVSHLALVFNSSSSILIYCCKDEKFLNVVLSTIGLSRFRRPQVSSPRGRGRGQNGGGRASSGRRGQDKLMATNEECKTLTTNVSANSVAPSPGKYGVHFI